MRYVTIKNRQNPSQRRRLLPTGIFSRFALASLAILLTSAGCAGDPKHTNTPESIATITETIPQLTPTLSVTGVEQDTATPEAKNGRVVIDISQATLEHTIVPECVNQFPVAVEDGLTAVCFTFDNWVIEKIELAGGYEMIVGAEGWYEQNGQNISVLIPLATANREKK